MWENTVMLSICFQNLLKKSKEQNMDLQNCRSGRSWNVFMFWLEFIRSVSWSLCFKSHWQVWLWGLQKALVAGLHRGRVTAYWWLSHTSRDFTSLEIRLLQHMRSSLSAEGEFVSFQWVLEDSQYSLPTGGFTCSPKAEHKESSGADLRGPSVPSLTLLRAHVTGLSRKLPAVENLAVRVKTLKEQNSWILPKTRQVYTAIRIPNWVIGFCPRDLITVKRIS